MYSLLSSFSKRPKRILLQLEVREKTELLSLEPFPFICRQVNKLKNIVIFTRCLLILRRQISEQEFSAKGN